MDNFYEQLNSLGVTTSYKVVNAFTYVLLILGLFNLTILQIVPAALLILSGLGLFFLKKKMLVEYEYAFTNGEVDIDKIIEMKRRKKVLNLKAKDIEILAKAGSDELRDHNVNGLKVVDCSLKGNNNIYEAVVSSSIGRVLLRFAPNDELLNLLHKYNPRAVKIYR